FGVGDEKAYEWNNTNEQSTSLFDDPEDICQHIQVERILIDVKLDTIMEEDGVEKDAEQQVEVVLGAIVQANINLRETPSEYNKNKHTTNVFLRCLTVNDLGGSPIGAVSTCDAACFIGIKVRNMLVGDPNESLRGFNLLLFIVHFISDATSGFLD
ncbi:hypothetical protein ACJX0J_034948, partial [Zea mays]